MIGLAVFATAIATDQDQRPSGSGALSTIAIIAVAILAALIVLGVRRLRARRR